MKAKKPIFHGLEADAYDFLIQVRTNIELLESSVKSFEEMIHRYPILEQAQEIMNTDIDNLRSVDASICALFPGISDDVALHLGQESAPTKGRQRKKTTQSHKPSGKKKARRKKIPTKKNKSAHQDGIETKKPVTARYLCNSCGEVQSMGYVGEAKDCAKCGARKAMSAVDKYDDKGSRITLTEEEYERI